VLRTLPSSKQRRVPFRLRHRTIAAALALVTLLVVAGVAAWLVSRTHHGNPKVNQPPPAPQLVPVGLCSTCAHDYNPDALGSDKSQNPGLTGLAIDGNPNTAWQTQQYYDGTLGKKGVGLYVDAAPGIVARNLLIDTSTPGWSGQIWASNTTPNRSEFTTGAGGWVQLASVPRVSARQKIPLTGTTRYRYYLVWITSLPPYNNSVSLNEVALYKNA
jgi:eukaryotic-like serine/threonine-protein kinase